MNSTDVTVTSTALITGANGFVGQPLCAALLAQGWRVKGALRSPHQLGAGLEPVIVGEIDGETDWTNALSGVDVVLHLAARVHVMKDDSIDPLAEFLKVNLHGTTNLARQAAKTGVKRLVYISSIKVNGESTGLNQSFSESDSADPQDPYGVSKWQAEQALQQISQETGLEIVIVRLPLVYGPGVKGNFISLLSAIDKGVPLPLAGANNARSLIYVGNLVDALSVCAKHPAAAGQTFLVSDGEDVSTAMLVEKIARVLGRSNRAFYFPPVLMRAAGMVLGRSAQIDRLFDSLRVNSGKIRNQLSWFAPYTLEQGLRATADWYRSNRSL